MITVYSKDNCPQCRVALAMIKSKGLDHAVLKLDHDFTRDDLLKIAPQAKSFPQVVDGVTLIGGVPELQKYLLNK